MITRCCVGFGLFSLVHIDAGAQAIAGKVVRADSVTPLSSVIVIATDERAAVVARSLTSQQGDFFIRLPAPGRYSLTMLRLGFRPTRGPEISVANGEVSRTKLIAASATVSLSAMHVREHETCRVSADTGLLVAAVWEEARKAMLTLQLGSGPTLLADWIEYDRVLAPSGQLVEQQRIRSASHPTTHVFRSVSADSLHAHGYVIDDKDGLTYHAPDANVLLSDLFVGDHCFRLSDAHGQGDTLVGVAFAPSAERRGLREVEGIIWVHRFRSELRLLEFRYLNLPAPANAANSGGRIEFHRLPDGRWFVNRWSIRMPQLASRTVASTYGMNSVVRREIPYVRNVQITGGEVMRARQADSTLYLGRGETVQVQLVGADSSAPLVGTMLTLAGTDYSGVADSLGTIRVSPVLAGRYRATVRTPVMEAIGMPAIERDVTTHSDAGMDTVSLPTARKALEATCPSEAVATGEGMLHGRVRNEQSQTIADGIVTTTWKALSPILRSGGSVSASIREKQLVARTDAFGYWRACGVPRDTPLSISVGTEAIGDLQTANLGKDAFATVDLLVRRRTVASTSDPVRSSDARVSMEIQLRDDAGAPITDAIVEIVASDSRTTTVTTSSSGRALFQDVSLGAVSLSAKRVGFAPGQLVMTLTGGRAFIPVTLSALRAPMLDTIRVQGIRSSPSKYAEFEARRNTRQAAASFSREQIERRNPASIWQMLSAVAGITVSERDDKVVATSTRGMINFANAPCFLSIAIDGNLVKLQDLRQLPTPADVHGLEVFVGPSSIPLQYGGTGADKACGLIAVWTR